MIIPVGPGVSSIEPISSEAGRSVELKIRGYNTRFRQAENIQVFLRNDHFYFCPERLQVIADNEIKVLFNLPAYPGPEPAQVMDLIVSDNLDGTFGQIQVFRLKSSTD